MSHHPNPSRRSAWSIWSSGIVLTGLLGAGLLGAGLGCTEASVQYDYDAKTPYSGYRTFDWLPGPGPAPGSAGEFDNAIMNDRVYRAVETELLAKGFRRVVDADPDFLVRYFPRAEPSRSRQVHLGLGFGMGPLGVGVAAPVGAAQRQAVAGIVLEIQDGRSRSLVWKATAPGALQESERAGEADADVKEAIRAMLKRFPPVRP